MTSHSLSEGRSTSNQPATSNWALVPPLFSQVREYRLRFISFCKPCSPLGERPSWNIRGPGDRRGGFDFAYRIPGARDWLTFYADAFTDDDRNPWLAWNKTALTSGLYLARIPGIPKLDFRVEGVYTDPPGGGIRTEHGFFYDNDRYRSGYTNEGNLIGSWIGREGQGAQAWTTYWFNPKSNIQLNFRHQSVSPNFVPAGGALTDFGISTDYRLRSNLALSAWVQYERWRFPVIQSNAGTDVTTALQITYEPTGIFRHSRSAANATASQP